MKTVTIKYDGQNVNIPEDFAKLYGMQDGYEIQSASVLIDLINRTTSRLIVANTRIDELTSKNEDDWLSNNASFV